MPPRTEKIISTFSGTVMRCVVVSRRLGLVVGILLVSSFAATSQQTSIEAQFQQALNAQKNGDANAAIAGYLKVLQQVPILLPAHLNLGEAYVETNRYDEAAQQFRIAQKQAPTDTRISALLGNALILGQRYSDAIHLLDDAHKSNPADVNITLLLGEALLHTPDLTRGLSLVHQVAVQRHDPNALLLAGLTETRMGKYAEARADLTEALKQDSTLPNAHTYLGIAEYGLGNEDAAKADFSEALKQDGRDTDAAIHLAALLRSDGDLQEARKFLDHALSIDPHSLAAQYQLAKIEMAQHQDEQAMADLKRIAAQSPNSPQPHFDLAVLYFRLHRQDEGSRERALADQLTQKQSANSADPLATYSAR